MARERATGSGLSVQTLQSLTDIRFGRRLRVPERRGGARRDNRAVRSVLLAHPPICLLHPPSAASRRPSLPAERVADHVRCEAKSAQLEVWTTKGWVLRVNAEGDVADRGHGDEHEELPTDLADLRTLVGRR